MTATAEAIKTLVLTRMIDAPRDLVFEAWTNRDMLAQWWGPYRFTNPVCEIDVRPGGAMRIHMRGPDGADHPMAGTYRVVEPPTRLIFVTTAFESEAGVPGLEVLNTVTFEDDGGKTKLTLRAEVQRAIPEVAPALAGMQLGWAYSLDRLAQLAAEGQVREDTSNQEIVATRLIDAPREVVFKAWTDPGQIVKWWGPNGFTTTISQMDVRPGGIWEFVMHGPDGTDYPNRNVYLNIVPPERIVFAHEVSPLFTMNVAFEDVDGKTSLTMTLVFESAEVCREASERYGAVQGAHQTLQHLAEHVAS